ncbi:hypothetical protein [Streptomyces heilongjiangensis]|uniref:Uncharacterized protein n=1 Tax=Streptomyces heilongjiangensis TaxID=945052 RepID=A0ABW1B2D2_9ACTN
MVRPRGGVAVAALVLVAAVSGCEPGIEGSAGPADEPGGGGPALAAVESLTVKGRAPRTGYDREEFGTPWADTDSNDCDTRVISMLRRMTEVFVQLMQGGVARAH